MNIHARLNQLNTTHKSLALRMLLLLLLIAALYIGVKVSAGAGDAAAASPGGAWELSDGSWYYTGDTAPRNGWLSEEYFIDESGRMATDEWIYTYRDGTLHHSKMISLSDMADIDMDRLYYVGSDGLRVKNKTIYYTPISFDADGRCNLSIADLNLAQGTDSGLDGLRRYIVLDDGLKEYY